MVSLARLWQESGARPAAVIGHSQGEIAAAHIAGALSLQDAARVVSLRAKAMTTIAGQGGMLSVSLSPEQLKERLLPFGERLSLAAINGPASLVISGEPEALAELEASCERDGVRAQPIAVDYAAHSAQIEALEQELLEAFAPISPQSSEIPFRSTVSAEVIDTAGLDATYWYRNLRHTVLFEPTLRSLLEQGQRGFIEIGPHPVLAFGATETIEDALDDPREATLIPTLRREEGTPSASPSPSPRPMPRHRDRLAAFFKGSAQGRSPCPPTPSRAPATGSPPRRAPGMPPRSARQTQITPSWER